MNERINIIRQRWILLYSDVSFTLPVRSFRHSVSFTLLIRSFRQSVSFTLLLIRSFRQFRCFQGTLRPDLIESASNIARRSNLFPHHSCCYVEQKINNQARLKKIFLTIFFQRQWQRDCHQDAPQ